MRLLLDSHALIWAVDDPTRLSVRAHAALQDPGNELLIGAGTIWELAIKVGLGKLTLSMPYKAWMARTIIDLELTVLPITVDQAEAQIALPNHHRDPFDRLLAAQAQTENLAIVSRDAIFDQYGIIRWWEESNSFNCSLHLPRHSHILPHAPGSAIPQIVAG